MALKKQNILQYIQGFLEFGTGSVIKGLKIIYISFFVFIILAFLLLKFRFYVESQYGQTVALFYIILAGFMGIPISSVCKSLGKKLNSFNTECIFIFFAYLNLCLAFLPSNISKILNRGSKK